jgi:hypothetical protein
MFSGESLAKVLCIFLAAAALELLGLMPHSKVAAQSTGDVYVLSNQDDRNAVIVFHRSTGHPRWGRLCHPETPLELEQADLRH